MAALQRLLGPLARLAVAQGVSHAALQEQMKLALVQAADAAQAELPPHRRVSRISTVTGIHRREVSRLLQVQREGLALQAPAKPSRASELLAHWLTSPPFRDRRGRPRRLPRLGAAPSFEALAQAVTRDVHPRGMLDELLRLGMAQHDPNTDTVRLTDDAAAPRGDAGRRLQFLGDNVGDHLAAAVDNVLAETRPHFEQAVFADGLSPASMAEVRGHVSAHWQALLKAMVPLLEALVARDASAATATQRLRIGLYSFDQSLAAAAPAAAPAPPPALKSKVKKP